MLILGIDPGSRIAGYGLVHKEGGRVAHHDNGLIDCRTCPSFPERLVLLFETVQSLIRKENPQVLAIENVFYAKNVQSTVKLAHARGVILLAASLLQIPIFEYTPLEIKQAVVGYGQATKDQIQKMVKAILTLPQVAEENASDALAVAICHAHSEKIKKIS